MKDLYIALFSAAVVFFICRWIYLYSQKKEVNFFDKEKNVKTFLIVFYISLVILLIADVIATKMHLKHDHIEIGNAYEFYAFYGFVSCVMLIFIAKVLRVLIKRDENYYDK